MPWLCSKGEVIHLVDFLAFSQKETTFVTVCSLSNTQWPFWNGIKFEREAKIFLAELPSLKVYSFPLSMCARLQNAILLLNLSMCCSYTLPSSLAFYTIFAINIHAALYHLYGFRWSSDNTCKGNHSGVSSDSSYYYYRKEFSGLGGGINNFPCKWLAHQERVHMQLWRYIFSWKFCLQLWRYIFSWKFCLWKRKDQNFQISQLNLREWMHPQG